MEVLADSLYGSDDNCKLARKKGVELVSPCMGSPPKGKRTLSDFEFHEDGRVARRPMGHGPIKTKHKKNRFTTLFDARSCKGFRNRYRFRAGIEGSISGFDRKRGAKKLRVRGKRR